MIGVKFLLTVKDDLRLHTFLRRDARRDVGIATELPHLRTFEYRTLDVFEGSP